MTVEWIYALGFLINIIATLILGFRGSFQARKKAQDTESKTASTSLGQIVDSTGKLQDLSVEMVQDAMSKIQMLESRDKENQIQMNVLREQIINLRRETEEKDIENRRLKRYIVRMIHMFKESVDKRERILDGLPQCGTCIGTDKKLLQELVDLQKELLVNIPGIEEDLKKK